MHPDLPTGLYPFWFWNDHLTVDEIRRQVQEMSDQGIKGFFIHPRQGLGQPYLSEAFFEMVDAAVDAAEQHGLKVHLYDEYPYPSGIAGGEVVLGQPQFAATRLRQETHRVEGGHIRLALPRGKILNATAYLIRNDRIEWDSGLDLQSHIGIVLDTESYNENTGLTMYNRKRYFASNPTPYLEITLPDTPHQIFISAQIEVTRHKYWDHFVDVLNKDAIRQFIACTHKRYHKRYAKKFGTTIVSIFVDETAPHWSDKIPETFRKTYGYNLLENLPALQDVTHPDHLKVAHDLYRLRYRMFCDAFETPISTWCQDHNILYSGEKHALRLSQLNFMDIPGCDPGHTKAGAKMDLHGGDPRRNARSTASGAYFYDKIGSLCECYHSMGWSATLQDAKLVAEGLLQNGIQYLVPHGFFYSTHALKKHDAPPTFFFQMPYWPFFHRLTDRMNRIAKHFQNTYIDADILVVEPGSGMPTKDDHEAYMRLQDCLLENHLEFLMVDTDILEKGKRKNEIIHLKDLEARLVIVPPMPIIEQPLQTWLNAYEADGGHVIYCDRTFDAKKLVAQILTITSPTLSIQEEGKEIPALHVVKRKSHKRTLWFVLNTGGQKHTATFPSQNELQEHPLDNALPTELKKENGTYTRTVYPFDSFLLESTQTEPTSEILPQITIPITGPAYLKRDQKNLLRMDEWQMSLLDENRSPAQTATVHSMPLSNQLHNGKFRFQPEFRTSFGSRPELDFPELTVRYAHTFENTYAGPVELVMEPGSIVGAWAIHINNADPIHPEHLAPTDTHIHGSLGIDITPSLREGTNTITVELTTNRTDGGLLNPIYLAGDFGVTLDPVTLTDPLNEGTFESYRQNRIPFYDGTIEYTTTFELDAIPENKWILANLTYEHPFYEASEVSVNNAPFQPILWEPRRFKLAAEHLRVGTNQITTRVHTSLIRSFEGTWFDYTVHQYRDVREGL